jgi:site-specific recombinase XerD
MELLQSGVDHSVIALWLGHESPETTQIYLQADFATRAVNIFHVEVDFRTLR